MDNPYAHTPPQLPPPPNIAPGSGPSGPSTWPNGIGILCIILGSFAAIGGLISFFTSKVMAAASKMPGGESLSALPTSSTLLNIVLPTGTLLLGILCLVGGICLLKRKKQAANVLRVWAVLKIIFSVAIMPAELELSKQMINKEKETIFNSVQISKAKEGESPEQAAARENAHKAAAAIGGDFMDAMILGASIFSLFWRAALPIFLLIWLSRKKIREEMQFWPLQTPAMPASTATDWTTI